MVAKYNNKSLLLITMLVVGCVIAVAFNSCFIPERSGITIDVDKAKSLISVGMSEGEMLSLIGEPSDRWLSPIGATHLMYFDEEDEAKILSLTLRDERVIYVEIEIFDE